MGMIMRKYRATQVEEIECPVGRNPLNGVSKFFCFPSRTSRKTKVGKRHCYFLSTLLCAALNSSVDRKGVNGIIHNHVWNVAHGRHRLLAYTSSGIFVLFLFSISFPRASSSIGEPDLKRQAELRFKQRKGRSC